MEILTNDGYTNITTTNLNDATSASVLSVIENSANNISFMCIAGLLVPGDQLVSQSQTVEVTVKGTFIDNACISI